MSCRLPSSVPTQMRPCGQRRLADGIDGRVHLGRGVVDCDAARLLLFLLLRIVGRQVGGDPLPGLTVITRAEQEL